jgi:hypothetical protein
MVEMEKINQNVDLVAGVAQNQPKPKPSIVPQKVARQLTQSDTRGQPSGLVRERLGPGGGVISRGVRTEVQGPCCSAAGYIARRACLLTHTKNGTGSGALINWGVRKACVC